MRVIPQVEVTFDIDANGILNVSAKDKATGKIQKITITASSGLSKEEVEKMRQEAEMHAEEDKKKKEQAEIKNQADAVVFQMEKLIKDAGDKMKPEDKKELEEKIEAVKKVKDSTDVEDIKKKLDDLNQSAQRIGTAMYQQGQAASADASASQGGEEPKKNEDGTVEGQFEEKK